MEDALQRLMKFRPSKRIILGAVLAVIGVVGCCHLSVTRYDQVTVNNLMSLKPEVSTVYDGLASDPVDQTATGGLSARLAIMVQYEIGKGAGNRDTADQFETIQSMYERHLKERAEDGKWTPSFIADKKTNVLKAIDTAISTENLKNRK